MITNNELINQEGKMGCNLNHDAVAPLMESYKADQGRCIISWIKETVLRFRQELCGANVFCREGMAQIHKIVGDISEGAGDTNDFAVLLDTCNKIAGMADCEAAKGIAVNISHALTQEREQLEAHIKRKRCIMLCCSGLLTYYVAPATCVGCGGCSKICQHNAVKGTMDMIHVIDQDECVKCGDCVQACAAGAITKATNGTVLPKLPEEPVPVGSIKSGLGGLRGGLRKHLGAQSSTESDE